MKRPFGKPATTHAQQMALLQQRGMVVDDPAAAEFYLQHLNYYRLGAYWLPFEADHATHRNVSTHCVPHTCEGDLRGGSRPAEPRGGQRVLIRPAGARASARKPRRPVSAQPSATISGPERGGACKNPGR